MKRHLQAVLAVLLTFIVVLVIVDRTVLYSSPNLNLVGVWANELHVATLQMMHAQTPAEASSAALHAAVSVVGVPIGFALFIGIPALTVAVRILGFIVRKAAR